MGSLEVDLFALRLTRQLSCFYSWRPDLEAEATDAFMQHAGLCQSHMVLNTSLPDQGQATSSTFGVNNTFMENSAVVYHSSGTTRGSSMKDSTNKRVLMPKGQEFLMQQGVPQLIAWPISGNPIHHEGFLTKLQTSCSHLGGAKQTPTIWFLLC